MVNDYYEMTLELLDKTQDAPTQITQGKVVNGDLRPFRHRVELVNTGNSRSDHGVLTLRIPPDGTFVRTEPILIDEGAKDEYVIQAQIRQPDGAGGTRKGKVFRFTIGTPTIQDDVGVGETLKIQLIPIEYRIKEHLTSKQLKFFTPKRAFEKRCTDYNITKGSSEPAIIISTNNPDPDDDSIQLPDNETLKQNWEPLAPSVTWDLLREVIDRLSLPAVNGGTFKDYYFDFESTTAPIFGGDITTGSINTVNVKAGLFGGNDTGITLDPLSVTSPVDSERDKTVMADMIRFKNNVIMEGGNRGSLPMEKAKFGSDWEHAQARPEYDNTATYFDGSDGVNAQSKVRVSSVVSNKEIIRYFEYIGTNGTTGQLPIDSGQTDWKEDFTTIPEWSGFGEYLEGQIVYTKNAGTIEFYVVNSGKRPTRNDPSPVAGGNSDWTQVFQTIPESQHVDFYSYTPWTSDFLLQQANISDSTLHDTGIPNTNYEGAIPDWNFERANFDRVKSDDQFEQISTKAVVRAETDPTNIQSYEIQNGSRFLINGTGALGTDFEGHDNKIAEWFQPPFETSGEWKFSKAPGANDEIVTDLDGARVWGWDGVSWSLIWAPDGAHDTKSSPFHTVSDGSLLPPGSGFSKPEAGICLVEGATQIPGQAFRLTFDWNFGRAPLGSNTNLSSRGAWWVQHLPIPRIHNEATSGRSVGDKYLNSTLDSNNLDLDSKGQQGWNNGLDSEDLGRINAIVMKIRLSIHSAGNNLINGYANMPFKAWAIDIFGRIWFFDFTVRRNGQYSFIRIPFGENAPQKLYHNRIDELFEHLGFTFSQNFFLKEKQFTGIEFDWRFVKSWGIFWNVSYDDNGMYVGVRDSFVKSVEQWAHQIGSYTLGAVTRGAISQGLLVIDHVHLDIDELAFEKRFYVNSDDSTVPNARTIKEGLFQENDYLNLKGRARALKARSEFINQQWYMMAHGDVRMRLGEKFKIKGSRVPEQPSNYTAWSGLLTYNKGDKVERTGDVWQSLQDNNDNNIPENSPTYWVNLNESVCAQVKHIIDNDGYMIEVLGVRKFVF